MSQNTVRYFASIGAIIALTFGAGFDQAHAGVVTSSLDDGSLGSLRQVINNAASGETIIFAPSLNGKTIILTNGQLVLGKNVVIAGPGASQLKISGNNASRVFLISKNVTATISGLTISDGNGVGATSTGGGAVGGVVLTNSGTNTLSGTTAVTGGTLMLAPGSIPSGSAATTVNAVLTTGAGGLVTVGSGTLTLAGTNNYAGPTTVTGGTLFLNPGTVIPSGSATTTVNTLLATNAGGLVNVGSGTLVLAGANTSGGSAAVVSGTFTVNPGTLPPTGAPTTVNAGGLVTTGSGTAILAGSNTYTGATTITGGTLALNSGTALANGNLAVNAATSGATLRLTAGTALPTATTAITVNALSATNSAGAVGSAAPSVGNVAPVQTNDGTLSLSGGGITGTSGGSGALAFQGMINIGGAWEILTVSGFPQPLSFHGGAILNAGGTLTLKDSVITANIARNDFRGGAIANDHGDLIVINSIISGNQAREGAGIYNSGFFVLAPGNDSIRQATLTVIGSTVSGNVGIGISNSGGICTVTGSTVSGNRGAFVDGIENNLSATCTLTNSTIAGTGGFAAGVRNNNTSTLVVKNCTIAGGGSGIHNSSSKMTLSNTILAKNGVNLIGVNIDVISLGYNLSDDTSTVGLLGGPGDLNNTLAGLDVDAQGKPRLQDNGGPTKTIALLPASAAVDRGNPAFNPNPPLPSDQRGFPRVANGRIDIGAFETQTPRSLLVAVQKILQSLPPANDSAGRAVRKALDDLTQSLNAEYWVNESHLGMKGHWVFNAHRSAVEALTKVVAAQGPLAADAQDWIDYIVEADEVLARTAIRDAAAGDPKKLAEANREFAKGVQALDQSDFRQAIGRYAHAWEHALKAIKKFPLAPPVS